MTWVECSTCLGEGALKVGAMSERECPDCEGDGQVQNDDDLCGLCGAQQARKGLTACRQCAG